MALEKFPFTTDYQLDLLAFSLVDKEGYKAVELYNDGYFVDIHHAIIAKGIKDYYKKFQRVPIKSLLKEELNLLFKHRDFVESLLPEDRKSIISLVDSLYRNTVKQGDQILEKCAQFVSYSELKGEIENINLLDFESYIPFSLKVQKAINISKQHYQESGTYLIKDISHRQLMRQSNSSIIPTPFRQLNQLTNAGGYSKGSIIVVLDKPKQLKTAMMVNVARGYMRMKKKVLLIDFENGQEEYAIRLEQSIARKSKKEILTGESDSKIKATLRKYKRLGAETYIRRLPAFSNANHIQSVIDEIYRDDGVKFDVLILDYLAMMRSISGKDDDFGRISDAYVDIANLALKNDLDHIWTPHHVLRSADKREKSRYKDVDIAKCIDIVRHVAAIWGLNRDDYEKENNQLRMELVVQRDGLPSGRVLFNLDANFQRVDEFTQAEIQNYYKHNNPLKGDEFSEDDLTIPNNVMGDEG